MRTVFFERLTRRSRPLVWLYQRLGWTVRAYNFTYDLKRIPWIRRLIASGKIDLIYVVQNTREHGAAIDETEMILNSMPKDASRSALSQLFASSDTELIFKKRLLDQIFRCVYIHNDIQRRSRSGDHFVPDVYTCAEKLIRKHGSIHLDELRNLRIPLLIRLFSTFSRASERLKWKITGSAYFLLQSLLLDIGRLRRRPKPEIKKCRFLIPLDYVQQTKHEGKRSFDFLLDGEFITKENSLFLVTGPIPSSWLAESAKKGYEFFDLRQFTSRSGILAQAYDASIARRLRRAVFKFVFSFQPTIEHQIAFINGLHVYVQWQILLSHVHGEHYIYTNQEGASQVAKNCLMHNAGVSTWSYPSFIGGGLLYAYGKDFESVRHVIWAFQNPMHLVAVSEDVVRYNQLHKQRVQNYHVSGNLYSQMARELREDEDRKAIAKEIFKDFDPAIHKIVSFFDTTFIYTPECPTSIQDGTVFYREILELMDSQPNLRVILKPSKDESFYLDPSSEWSAPETAAEMMGYWSRLKANPKAWWAGDRGDLPMIMSISDLVVTHCMSSPTAEALGAGIKAIWYESTRKHEGTHYCSIPGLIVHGKDSLSARLEELLFRTDANEYKAYLRRYVDGSLQPESEGQGLNRFRNLLLRSGDESVGGQ